MDEHQVAMRNERQETRRRIAHELGIPSSSIERIVEWPGEKRLFRVLGPLFDAVTEKMHPEFIGSRLRLVGVLHDTPPATNGPKMALLPRDVASLLRRDSGLFQHEMLVQPTLEIWYAEIHPPDSELGVVIRWNPQGGKRLSVPEVPVDAIRGEDLDKAKMALDLLLVDLSLRRPAHRPNDTGSFTREEFRQHFAAAWNNYVAEHGHQPSNEQLIPLLHIGRSTFYELKRKDPRIVQDLRDAGLIRTYSDT